jgi:hypothetical protein
MRRYFKVLCMTSKTQTVTVMDLHQLDVDEEGLGAISLKKFVSDINNCADCRTNPAFFLSSREVPVCARHWNAIAEAPIAWTKEGKIRLLTGV